GGAAVVAVTMRRQNGSGGVHELASGTRTMRLPARPARLEVARVSQQPARPVPAGLPDRVGAFRLTALLRDSADEKVLLGEDPALSRPVWVWLRLTGGPPVPPRP